MGRLNCQDCVVFVIQERLYQVGSVFNVKFDGVKWGVGSIVRP
jgi:hypothetical protein